MAKHIKTFARMISPYMYISSYEANFEQMKYVNFDRRSKMAKKEPTSLANK